MSGPKYSAKIVYGSLQVVGAADPLPVPEADDIQVLGFAINGVRKGLRLTLAHRGALIYVALYRDTKSLEAEQPTFCQRIYDGVEKTWDASEKIDDSWWDRKRFSAREHEGHSKPEDQLFELVRGALPHLLESATAKHQGSLAGSQLWAEVSADADAAGRPRVTLVGDIFRELVHNDLPLLSDADFPHVPRHDLSAVDSYIGIIAEAICIVAGQKLSSVHGHQLALKTMIVATGRSKELPQTEEVLRDLVLGELKVLTSIPPHPNVMPAPLALLTVRDHQAAQDDSANSDDSDANTASRLVGWLQPVFTEFYGYLRRSKNMSTEYRLRYAYQLCCGVRHLFKHGFCHADLGLQNTLIAGSPPNDRVIVMDFEPVKDYHNKNGPTSPEADGHWIVSTDKRDGSTTYAHRDGEPVWQGNNIYADWERMPEALERLIIFNIGSMLSVLLNVRVVFPWGPDQMRRHIQLQQDVVVGADPIRDAWEASLPVDVRELTQRCCAYDPRERPLLDDVVEQLKKYIDAP